MDELLGTHRPYLIVDRVHPPGSMHLGVDSSGVAEGCLDIVVDASRGQQSVRAALIDAESRLGRQVVAAPANTVVLQSAAHAVVGYRAVLEADAAACARRRR